MNITYSDLSLLRFDFGANFAVSSASIKRFFTAARVCLLGITARTRLTLLLSLNAAVAFAMIYLSLNWRTVLDMSYFGGTGGIRTLDASLSPHDALAGR